MDVVAILPCRGRPAQTAENVRRLLDTAGAVDWQLIAVAANGDTDVLGALDRVRDPRLAIRVDEDRVALTYWEALAAVTPFTAAPLLCGLANDLLPGRHWLARGVAAYRARFGHGDGLMGFNDGLHGPEHSSHFLISRVLLGRYGGWPTHYRHNFGDTELCARARADGVYGKAAWAVLYHNHQESGAPDDAVYAAGRVTYAEDARLFDERRRHGWTL